MNEMTPRTIMRRSLNLFFVIFLLIGAIISGLIAIFYRSEVKTHLSGLKTQERYSVSFQGRVVVDVFGSIAGDLFFLSQQNELKNYLDTSSPASRMRMAKEYLNMATQKRIYDQIRFLDSSGMEQVRVNFNGGRPFIVPSADLQLKKKRYYFNDCFSLHENDVFVSPFDLNIEKGKVERPLKPVIRIGTPVFDAQKKKQGILLLNFLGQHLLDKVLETEHWSEGDTMLINANGYWLLNPKPELEWGFMFPDGKEKTFARHHPHMWQQILKEKEGQHLNKKGLFTYTTIYPLKAGFKSSSGSARVHGNSKTAMEHDEYYWILLSFIPAQKITEYTENILVKFFSFGAGLFVVVASGSWVLAFAITKKRIYQAHLKSMALFDSLTELPNRTLFFDRLTMILEESRRYDNIFSLLYIDLDGFKNVNDSLGHEAGDELLVVVAEQLRTLCRKSDTAARLGGDEFAVILPQLRSSEGAKKVARKIISSLSEPVQLAAGTVVVGASIGIAIFPGDGNEAEELLRQADTAMYKAKNSGKNTFRFVSDHVSEHGA